LRACVAFVFVLLAASSARADEPAPLELGVADDVVDAGAFAAALGHELAAPVIVVDASTAIEPEHARLTLRSVGRTRGRLELVRADGTSLQRTTRLPTDASERAATLVILAANLVRDEAGELLAMLRRPHADEVATTPLTEDVVAPPPLAPPEEPTVVAAPSLEPPIEEAPAPIEEPPAPVEPILEPVTPTQPEDPFLRLGLTSALGSIPTPTGYDVAWLAGLEAAATPLPFLAIGVRELGATYAQGGRWSVGGAPFAELAWRFVEWADIHGAVGAHVQYIAGNAYEAAGVAPLVVAGARVFVDRNISFALDTALRFVATHAFHAGSGLLPQGAVLWTGGVSITFHIS
jgi:hypothetical protein